MDTLTPTRMVIPPDIQDSGYKAQWAIGFLQATISLLDSYAKDPMFTDPVAQNVFMARKIREAVIYSEKIEHDLRIS
jgi:hypothetical protein